MNFRTLLVIASVALLAAPAAAAPRESKESLPTAASVEACWEKAGEDPMKANACLKSELTLVQNEYKSITEQVASLAKAWDKPSGGRSRWNQFIVSGQSFDTFVRRDCEFVSAVTKGNKTAEENAGLACRIGWYRLRSSMLTNRYLTQSRY